MVGITYVYVDTVLGFYGYVFFFFLHSSVGCLSMIVWTTAALGVVYVCVLYFCILRLFSANEHVSHGKEL